MLSKASFPSFLSPSQTSLPFLNFFRHIYCALVGGWALCQTLNIPINKMDVVSDSLVKETIVDQVKVKVEKVTGIMKQITEGDHL